MAVRRSVPLSPCIFALSALSPLAFAFPQAAPSCVMGKGSPHASAASQAACTHNTLVSKSMRLPQSKPSCFGLNRRPFFRSEPQLPLFMASENESEGPSRIQNQTRPEIALSEPAETAAKGNSVIKRIKGVKAVLQFAVVSLFLGSAL